MNSIKPIDGPRMPPARGGAATKLVILLHGYGADGNDLIGLAPHWARLLPSAAFIAPHAPEPCAMSPMGRQWWGIGTFSREERIAGAARAAPVLNAFIEQELDRLNLAESDLVLVGFSQGTMMALHVGLRRQRQLAGILGYSGALVAPEVLPAEVVTRPPVLLIHGDRDEMLPIDNMFEAAQGLGEAGVAVEWHISKGVGHGIAPDGLELGGAFLNRALNGRA